MIDLPIHRSRDEIVARVRQGNRLVLTAPTGSGKSTQVPQMLLDAGIVGGQVLVLEPRRLAARMLAERVAWERDGRLGDEVGFQTRFESAVSRATRIRFITEGILPRMLLSDPELRGVGAIIFDEFHERSLNVDVGLGLAKALQERCSGDMKLIVMSATLGAEALERYLGCETLTVDCPMFPVDVSYSPPKRDVPIWEQAIRATAELLGKGAEGDVLLFMPGAFEIRKTVEAARSLRRFGPMTALPLYGDLPPESQRQVMGPAAGRKIIVATNIAETSLTIPGVRHVVDSGLVRTSRYDPGRGINMLVLEGISRESAAQRKGRAGREGPGSCVRLWSMQQQSQKPVRTDPEIVRTDLAETVLHVRSLGFDAPAEFPWLDSPDELALANAETVLRDLGAVSRNGRLTDLGRELVNLPMHPRLARLLIESKPRACVREATLVAAILSERPFVRNDREGWRRLASDFRNELADVGSEIPPRGDLFLAMNALQSLQQCGFRTDTCERYGINGGAARQIWRTFEYLLGQCRKQGLEDRAGVAPGESVLKCMLTAFPDHLAHRRDGGSLVCDLRNERTGELVRTSTVRDVPLLLAGEIREVAGRDGRVNSLLSMACEVREDWLQELFPNAWSSEEMVSWNERRREVEGTSITECLGVVLERRAVDVPPDRASSMLAEQVTRNRLPLKGWDKDVKLWIDRVRWVRESFPERGLIAYDETDVQLIVADICTGERRYDAVKKKPCLPYVQNALSWEDQQFVQQMAPERVMLPCRRRMRIQYRAGQVPRGRAQIQDIYGLDDTPRVAGGKIPVLMEILAPNMRAVQVTDDLAGFWRNLYPSVKKELARRYPKHKWQ